MQPDLESQQKLLLWLLAIQPDGSMLLSDTRLSFKSAARRKELQTFGLTQEFRSRKKTSGRLATSIQLTDKGWEWCQDHLHESIDSKSPQVRTVLSGILNALSRYFQNQDHCNSLGEFFALADSESTDPAPSDSPSQALTRHDEPSNHPTAGSDVTPGPSETHPTSQVSPHMTSPRTPGGNSDQVTQDLLTACHRLSHNEPNGRIRLKDLRPLLSQYRRSEIDAVLVALQQEGRLQLWRLDDATEMTPQDREAAITSKIGTEKHIVYLEGVLS